MAKKLQLQEYYSQRDSRWSSKMLGFNAAGTQYTIGNYGCMITSVCAYLCAVGHKETPDTLNTKLKALGEDVGYTKGSGLFIFNSLKLLYPDIVMDYVSAKWTGPVPDSGVQKMRDLIDQGEALITEVDFYPSTVMEDMHWVLVYGYTDSGDFYIMDPWTGTKILMSTYGIPSRVMYCYRTYGKTIPAEGSTAVTDAETFEKLVHNSTQWDETVKYLEITSYPKDTQFEDVQRVIAGYKSRITDLQTQLTTCQAELANREEQVSRLKQQVLDEQKLRNSLSEQLTVALAEKAQVIGVYEAQLKAKQGQIDEMGEEKGELNTNLALAQADLTTCKADALKSVTIGDCLLAIWNKIRGQTVK